jgi:hypothetical protein
VKKNRKKRLKTWEKFRGSSSRISTYPNYFAFEAEEYKPKDPRQIMEMFDWLSDSEIGRRFSSTFIDYGLYKDGNKRGMAIDLLGKWRRRGLSEFLESFGTGLKNIGKMYVIVGPVDSKEEIEIDPDLQFIKLTIPENYDKKQALESYKTVWDAWIENLECEKEYQNDFIKWWMRTYLFAPRSRDFPRAFQSALVEWMRQAPLELVKEAYGDLIIKSNDESIDRYVTAIGNKKIVDHVNQGIEIFDINIKKEAKDIQKGASLIKKFGF